jgi:hypothetical protein
LVTPELLAEVAEGQGEPLTRLARRVPSYRSGRPASLSRLLRWAMHGVRGPDGAKVALEAVRTPGGWISTPAALCRFFSRLTPRTDADPQPTPRSPSARSRAAERAGKQLEALGI